MTKSMYAHPEAPFYGVTYLKRIKSGTPHK